MSSSSKGGEVDWTGKVKLGVSLFEGLNALSVVPRMGLVNELDVKGESVGAERGAGRLIRRVLVKNEALFVVKPYKLSPTRPANSLIICPITWALVKGANVNGDLIKDIFRK